MPPRHWTRWLRLDAIYFSRWLLTPAYIIDIRLKDISEKPMLFDIDIALRYDGFEHYLCATLFPPDRRHFI